MPVTADEDAVVVRGDADRDGDHSPLTLLEPSEHGVLRSWENADDRSWWRWSVELSNHTGRPPTGPATAALCQDDSSGAEPGRHSGPAP